MNSIHGYQDYQDSGEAWISRIPSEWDLKKLKHLFKEKKIKNDISLPSGSISFGNVIFKEDEKVPESTKATYQVLNKGEFLINPLNLNYDLISLRIALSDKDVVVSSGYIILQNIYELSKSYFKWLLHRYDVAYMKLLGSGVRQTISFNHIANSLLPYPPPATQTAIANFLDEKTAKIDKAIAQKERMIELLKERKQIMIQELVTGKKVWSEKDQRFVRLDQSGQKSKDSGVEWIGEIPEGWEVKRLKYLVRNIISGPFGSSLVKDEYVKSGYKVYGQEQVIPNDLTIGDYYISKRKFEKMRRYEIFENDILVSCVGTFGKIALVPKNFEKGIINPRLIKMSPDTVLILPTYLLEVLLSDFSFVQFDKISRGGTMGVINIDLLSKLIMVIPPREVQDYILGFLSEQKHKISQLINTQVYQIEKLKEYKTVLIDAAVTGKIRVD